MTRPISPNAVEKFLQQARDRLANMNARLDQPAAKELSVMDIKILADLSGSIEQVIKAVEVVSRGLVAVSQQAARGAGGAS